MIRYDAERPELFFARPLGAYVLPEYGWDSFRFHLGCPEPELTLAINKRVRCLEPLLGTT